MNSNLLFDFTVDKQNKTIHIRREFNAGIELVWKAWTTAELLDQWWGPQPWKAVTKTMDFRVGGHWLYAMVGPAGEKHWAKASFFSIEKEKSFASNEAFCDENGNINQSLPQGIWENKFFDQQNNVLVDMLLTYENLSDLEKNLDMGFKEGMIVDFQQLDKLLTTLP